MSQPSAQAAAETTSPPTSGTDPSQSATTVASTEPGSQSAEPETTSRPTQMVRLKTRNGTVEFHARAKERLRPAPVASAESASTKPEGSSSGPDGKATATGPASTATTDTSGGKPAEPAPHRALTIALEKEARLVEERRAFKAEREAYEAAKAQADGDMKLLQQARELVKGGKRLKAMELLGIDLDGAQDEFLAELKEETPEDKAARIVRDTLAKEREVAAQQAREAEEAAAQERTAVEQRRVEWYWGQVEEAYKARAAEFDPAAFEGVNAQVVQQRAFAECNATGKLPTASEALDLIQKDFDARLAKSKRYRPAETPLATTEKKDRPQATDTPKTLTTRGAGSVPVAATKAKRETTARERAYEAMRDMGIVK